MVAFFLWTTQINLFTMEVKTQTAQEIWKLTKGAIQTMTTPLFFRTWVKTTDADYDDAGNFEILCKNSHAIKQLEVIKPLIEKNIREHSKKEVEVVFKIGKPKEKIKEEEKKQLDTPLFKPLDPDIKAADKETRINAGLNPTYTFENYIMGDTNRLAYAIADSISKTPGTLYNPFFLYAGVGLGKTHLIQAIGNRYLDINPNAKVLYVTGEGFTNELIDLLVNKKGSNTAFRKKYRDLDVLIIDDIQFITGKEKTQEEFFHTFNDLFMKQKQIVLASDRPPEEFKNIEERITSRFKSGIMADIQKPDFELRAAILRAKRDYYRHSIPNGVIDYLAENVSTNIRELEASYMQVITTATALGAQDISRDIAQEVLGKIMNKPSNKPVNLNSILKAVCSYYSIKMTDIKGKRRTKDIVIPRQIAMYLMYDMTQTPFMSIGELLGGRDHTTIMHGVKKVEEELINIGTTRNDISNIKEYIYHN